MCCSAHVLLILFYLECHPGQNCSAPRAALSLIPPLTLTIKLWDGVAVVSGCPPLHPVPFVSAPAGAGSPLGLPAGTCTVQLGAALQPGRCGWPHTKGCPICPGRPLPIRPPRPFVNVLQCPPGFSFPCPLMALGRGQVFHSPSIALGWSAAGHPGSAYTSGREPLPQAAPADRPGPARCCREQPLPKRQSLNILAGRTSTPTRLASIFCSHLIPPFPPGCQAGPGCFRLASQPPDCPLPPLRLGISLVSNPFTPLPADVPTTRATAAPVLGDRVGPGHGSSKREGLCTALQSC